MIARGFFHISQSAAGHEITTYHVEAGISACHCAASDYESTNWQQILSLYDRLVQLDDSPIVALNRAVAVAQVHGPAAGVKAVSAIRDLRSLESYYLLYAVLAEFEMQLNNFRSASEHLRKSIRLTELKSEQQLLSNRLRECEERNVPSITSR